MPKEDPDQLPSVSIGQHLKVSRGIYSHHGICVGPDSVIHFASPGEGDGKEILLLLGAESDQNVVHQTTATQFAEAGEIELIEYDKDDVYPPLKVVTRAESRLGDKDYRLWSNNCEHFATWCVVADARSDQASFWKAVARGGITGFALGRLLTIPGAAIGTIVGGIVGGAHHWLTASRAVAPVYREFVDYASALYLTGTKRAHPFGKSFKHQCQVAEKVEFRVPDGREDVEVLFCYEGSWLFGHKNDWFVSERAIVWPGGDVYVDFHDVRVIGSNLGRLYVVTIDGDVVRLPSRFLAAKYVAKFLLASVAARPLFASDFRVSSLSVVKQMLHLALAGLVIAVAVGIFFPVAVPFILGVVGLVVLCEPFSFLDRNEHYGAGEV